VLRCVLRAGSGNVASSSGDRSGARASGGAGGTRKSAPHKKGKGGQSKEQRLVTKNGEARPFSFSLLPCFCFCLLNSEGEGEERRREGGRERGMGGPRARCA
jgi:hypothetical protein